MSKVKDNHLKKQQGQKSTLKDLPSLMDLVSVLKTGFCSKTVAGVVLHTDLNNNCPSPHTDGLTG